MPWAADISRGSALTARRHLLQEAENSTMHKPVWERCDYEQVTAPGAFVFLYALLIFDIFLGIAILCDDFFVPSLEGLSEAKDLSEDVAGATFLAAGMLFR